MTIGTLASIWRYPVKSLRFEALDEAEVEMSGVHGDRTAAYLVRSAEHPRFGKPFRGKENDRLHLATGDDEARALAAAASTLVERSGEGRFFDDAPVSILVDRWLDEVSAFAGYPVQPLRFRPNFFVVADDGFRYGEAELQGMSLQIGDVVLTVRSPIERCVVTTYDPEGGEPDPRILRFIAQQRNAWMGIYCDVERPGTVRVGDAVESL
ncbi:MAG: MOSC domain-containing protein [Candidatus Eremiobacteraeota bacterium]|nr:MOSC domain-containing protein [Candidatus Eremiobacteraeota bacterium]MBV8331789.1 MOSC domain-containing protein [Candidatus Eremiobacteraeota bacterium]